MKAGSSKGRSRKTYNNKVKKITKWYNHIVTNRQKDKKGQDKKPLKPLDFFIDKIKMPNEKTK